MMRTIWKGAISFGLVNIPIKLFTATNKNDIRFHYLHKDCNTPIETKRYCPHCEREVKYDELVKGYEYEENKYVVLSDEDFNNMPVNSTRTIDIIDFVSLDEIDPIFYIKTYYLKPNEGGEKPYLLLKRAMEKSRKVAISKITIRNKESMAVVRVMDDILAMETMFFADEVKDKGEFNIEEIEAKIDISDKEEKLAIEIVNNLTSKFNLEKYKNEYRDKLMGIIREKMEGKEIKIPEAPRTEQRVLDLMEKLQASVAASKKKGKKKVKKKTG
jgi:DNA end-binding protein Ku